MNKYCRSCSFFDGSQNACLYLNIRVDPNSYFCANHDERIDCGTCVICGKPMTNMNCVRDVLPDGDYRLIHYACAKKLNTCSTCVHGQICEFNTNPDPMPKVVVETVRQGNMVIQQQVRNPSRVEKFCAACPCFNHDFGCFKENNCCDGKWVEKNV